MEDQTAEPWSRLTPRQTDVLLHICRGLKNREIGQHLNTRESTVKAHVHNVMKRLLAKNRTELISIAAPLLNGSSMEIVNNG